MPLWPSAQDELLRLTGSTNTIFETIVTTANGTGAYYGADRNFVFQLVVAGAVTGTTPTLDVKVQDSADGTTYTDIGVAFPQQTTTMAVATGSLATQFPVVSVRTKPARPYLRVVKTTTGTSPSFASVGVFLVADPGGVA
jgi:hypothetical protein